MTTIYKLKLLNFIVYLHDKNIKLQFPEFYIEWKKIIILYKRQITGY